MSKQQRAYIPIKCYNKIFDRDKYLYSLGNDLRLPFPVNLQKAGVFAISLFAWGALLTILDINFISLFGLVLVLGPPILFAIFSTKKLAFFNDRNVFQFIYAMIAFSQEPKGWTDWNNNSMKDEYFESNNYFWVIRNPETQLDTWQRTVDEGRARSEYV